MDYTYRNQDFEVIIEEKTKRMSDSIIDQLIAYRKKLKMTQQDIADGTGIRRANVARLEGKKYTPTLESLMKYADCMDLELSLSLQEKTEDETHS
ncbi:MAG: helix-turn-helix transcriptional regulator [Schaedlerella sp.]|nr:helix-turn-helix transcriptional regulator [Lachnospiraceae bacterium]MDY4201924.1 helix-turn-helix transcriptional regulator [Schaedlerella sp.]